MSELHFLSMMGGTSLLNQISFPNAGRIFPPTFVLLAM